MAPSLDSVAGVVQSEPAVAHFNGDLFGVQSEPLPSGIETRRINEMDSFDKTCCSERTSTVRN